MSTEYEDGNYFYLDRKKLTGIARERGPRVSLRTSTSARSRLSTCHQRLADVLHRSPQNMISNIYQFGEDQRLYVPYRPGKGSHTANVGFIELKAQPERVAEIHELRGFPEFEELIRALNVPESSVRTLRIDTAKDEFPRDAYPHSFFSMLTFCFEICQGDEDKRYYAELYRFFVQVASPLLPADNVQVDFHLVPLTVKVGNYSGWALEIRLYGYGKSEEEARDAWARGFRQVNEFMLRIESENRNFP